MEHQYPAWHGIPKKTLCLLLAAALIYAGIWLFFSPKIFASTDEYAYAKGAFLLNGGNIYVDNPSLYCPTPPLPSGKYGTNYPIGKSLQLVPFAWLERIDVLFLASMLTHLLNFCIFILILRNKKINPTWAILYLVFPAFQWESRTLYAELWLLTFFLGAYAAWQRDTKKSTMLAGLLLGLGIFIRYDAALGLMAFGLQALLKERHRVIPFIAGATIPIIAVLGYNELYYGNAFSTGYGAAGSILGKGIPLQQVGLELLTFPILIFLTLPFSLYSAHKNNAHRVLFLALAALTFLFFVRFYSFWALGTSPTQIFTVRLRYFIPLLGLLMIPTLEWYASKWKHITTKWDIIHRHTLLLATIAAILLVSATVIMHSTHAQFLDERVQINQAIHAHTPVGATIIGSGDDCMFFIPPVSGNKHYIPVSSNPTLGENPVYLLNISYSTQENTGSTRQGVLDSERQLMKDFIAANKEKLQPIYSSARPFIEIWSYSP